MEKRENIFLIDWLTVTSKCDSVHTMINILGMSDVSWEHKESYMNGYPFRCSFNGINILYGAREDMGVCLTMSGTGCRAFETYSIMKGTGSWIQILILFVSDPRSYNITRLDIAFDDHTGILDIDEIKDDTDDHNYVSKSRWWKVEYGSEGCTIYHGSPQSNVRIRIYDKAAERGYQDDTHWIRVEIMLRDTNAANTVSLILAHAKIAPVFCGILRNYLTYRIPSGDSNKSRWPLAEYWERLLNEAAPLSVWSAPGEEYNIFKLTNFLVNQCGGAITCWREIFGLDQLNKEIKMKEIQLSPKYQRLIEQHKRILRKCVDQ